MSRIPDLNPQGTYVCFFDGSCTPNPNGWMGQGVVIRKDAHQATYKGRQPAKAGNTNNCSEYLALTLLLTKFVNRKGLKIRIYGDSNLVVSQMTGEQRILGGKYMPYALACEKLLQSICDHNDVKLFWIPREQNWEADKLSNT